MRDTAKRIAEAKRAMAAVGFVNAVELAIDGVSAIVGTENSFAVMLYCDGQLEMVEEFPIADMNSKASRTAAWAKAAKAQQVLAA